jgi:hypothetical protein
MWDESEREWSTDGEEEDQCYQEISNEHEDDDSDREDDNSSNDWNDDNGTWTKVEDEDAGY